jgi:hypothetical protein
MKMEEKLRLIIDILSALVLDLVTDKDILSWYAIKINELNTISKSVELNKEQSQEAVAFVKQVASIGHVSNDQFCNLIQAARRIEQLS